MALGKVAPAVTSPQVLKAAIGFVGPRPGCRTSRAIDLRTVDRHPLASVGTMMLRLRCS